MVSTVLQPYDEPERKEHQDENINNDNNQIFTWMSNHMKKSPRSFRNRDGKNYSRKEFWIF